MWNICTTKNVFLIILKNKRGSEEDKYTHIYIFIYASHICNTYIYTVYIFINIYTYKYIYIMYIINILDYLYLICIWVLLNPPTTDQPTRRPINPKFTNPLTKLYFKDLIIKKYLFCRMQTQLGKCKTTLRSFYLTFVFITIIKNIRRNFRILWWHEAP